jgi:hypothetical protein
VAGVPTAGQTFIDNCIWTCEVIDDPNASKYSVITRAYSADDVQQALNAGDSRSIYLEGPVTVGNGSWGKGPIVVANFRQVTISGPSTSQALTTWRINDEADLLVVGYAGTINIQDLVIELAQPCCSHLKFLGSWYFGNTPLTWEVFDTVLPAAFNVQPVRVPILTLPAHLTLTRVSIVLDTCDAIAFPKAVQQMEQIASNVTEQQRMSWDTVNSTLYCDRCTWQAAEQELSVFQGAVSTAVLVNSSITCLSWVQPPAPVPEKQLGPGAATAAADGGPPASGSAKAGFNPSIAIVIVVAVAASALMSILAFQVYRMRQKQARAHGNLSLVPLTQANPQFTSLASYADRAESLPSGRSSPSAR